MTGHAADHPGAGVARHRRAAVLVTGPGRAGVTAVAAALRARLPGRTVVEDLADDEAPAAVVFVVSAAAALTESDCAVLDTAAAHTDAVVGVVAKIDLHRHWPQMLQDAMNTLAAYAPRYRAMPWVAAAAAPNLGEPRVDNLVTEVCKQLDAGDVERRNKQREWEFQLRAAMAALQQQRETALRQRRWSKSAQTIALRGQLAQARVQLAHFARSRCGSLRGELHADAAAVTRRRLPDFEVYVRGRIEDVIGEVDRGAADRLTDVARRLGLNPDTGCVPAPSPEWDGHRPALKSRRLETQLMLMLGAGFGLGVALTLSRLFAQLAAGFTAAGAAACAVVGLAVTVWVVSTRRLLHDRAVLDRWVTEMIAALRCSVEELVALRVLSAESALTAALAERIEAEDTRLARRIAALDGELREHAAVVRRAAASRDREMPALQRALPMVRAELETD